MRRRRRRRIMATMQQMMMRRIPLWTRMEPDQHPPLSRTT